MTEQSPSSRPSSNDRIVEAALSLIAENGLGNVTMARVAETAGVARQTLYNHYSDIDAIVASAISRHNKEAIRLLEGAMQVVEHPTERLEQLVRHVVSVGAHAHHAPGIRHGLSARVRDGLKEYDDALDQSIRGVLQAGQQRGSFRKDLSLGVDTVLVRHMLNGLGELAATTPDRAAAIAAIGARTVLAAVEER